MKIDRLFVSLFVLTLLLLIFFIQKDIIFTYPSFIHAWAQGDRYALSLCFIDNGFDFFHPCTFHYNLQFPSKIPLETERGITAVDFPLTEYIVAILMKITGNTSPTLFRIFTLLYSLVGLCYLYCLSFRLSKSYFFSFLLVAFAFLSPVYFFIKLAFFLPFLLWQVFLLECITIFNTKIRSQRMPYTCMDYF